MPSSDNWLTARELLIPSLLFLMKAKSIINLPGHKHYITNRSPTANYWICSLQGVSQLKHFWDPLIWLRFCSDNINCRKQNQLFVPECTAIYRKFKSRQNILFNSQRKGTNILWLWFKIHSLLPVPFSFLGRQLSSLTSGLMGPFTPYKA